MLTASTLKGNWGTLLLPVNADDSIDLIRLGISIDRLISAGVDGIYSNGTAGEFHNQTEAEFDLVQSLLSDKCHQATMPFQIGASHPSPIISLERIKRSQSLRPAAYQVILPDWVVPDPDEQIRFLEKMALAADAIPLVLYNPPHAKQVLSPADLHRLQQAIPTLIGIKTGAGDAVWYQEMRAQKMSLSVFVPGHFLATGVQEGIADGAYSNVACIQPQAAQEWWRLIQTDLPMALKTQDRILQFFQRCILPYKAAGYSNPALDKFLAAIGGWASIGTRLRWPYKWIDEKDVGPARTIAQKMLPEFFKYA